MKMASLSARPDRKGILGGLFRDGAKQKEAELTLLMKSKSYLLGKVVMRLNAAIDMSMSDQQNVQNWETSSLDEIALSNSRLDQYAASMSAFINDGIMQSEALTVTWARQDLAHDQLDSNAAILRHRHQVAFNEMVTNPSWRQINEIAEFGCAQSNLSQASDSLTSEAIEARVAQANPNYSSGVTSRVLARKKLENC